jgi:hypothetical protein
MSELQLEAAMLELLARAGVALAEAVTDIPFAQADANVPVDKGDLKATGKVSDPVIEGDTVSVVMSWGNPDDQTGIVAIVQHERLDLNHPNGGTAKWAENGQLAFAPTMTVDVATRMR